MKVSPILCSFFSKEVVGGIEFTFYGLWIRIWGLATELYLAAGHFTIVDEPPPHLTVLGPAALVRPSVNTSMITVV
jgi:hypothetical protein